LLQRHQPTKVDRDVSIWPPQRDICQAKYNCWVAAATRKWLLNNGVRRTAAGGSDGDAGKIAPRYGEAPTAAAGQELIWNKACVRPGDISRRGRACTGIAKHPKIVGVRANVGGALIVVVADVASGESRGRGIEDPTTMSRGGIARPGIVDVPVNSVWATVAEGEIGVGRGVGAVGRVAIPRERRVVVEIRVGAHYHGALLAVGVAVVAVVKHRERQAHEPTVEVNTTDRRLAPGERNIASYAGVGRGDGAAPCVRGGVVIVVVKVPGHTGLGDGDRGAVNQCMHAIIHAALRVMGLG